MKKPKTTSTKPAEKVTIEQAVTTEATPVPPETPKKTGTVRKTPAKTKAAAAKPVAETPELAVEERIGLTAGDIWRYLAEQGATPVAKLVKDLTEEEKIIQRSLGWLAKEDKITLTVIDRIETLALKD